MSTVTSGTRLAYYADAIREALALEMRRDPNVVLFGEDIALYGGAFGVTRGLVEEFGSERVVNTPISEGGFTGLAIGAALTGLRPVVEFMFMDFITLAVDQIVNHAAKFRAVYGEQAKVPIVFRAAAGAGRSYGATHSQMLEGWFMHVPGLKVVAPATAEDARGLLISAIRDDNPVLVVEHKDLYKVRMPLAEEAVPIPLGKAQILREGDAVTVIAYSKAVHTAGLAAAQLAKEGIAVEVIDLRSLKPLDTETIAASVQKTGRAIIVTEAMATAGPSAEIACQILDHAFDYLEAPIVRLTTQEMAIPFSPTLEQSIIPSVEDVVQAVKNVL
ncbi:MAG: alpha-ketoacid dehydrogenase subunit beta [Armatimonadota bacterium]